MTGKLTLTFVVLILVVLQFNSEAFVVAADEGVSIKMGPLEMTAPAGWKQQQPRVRIIQYEFAVPAVEGDENDGRMTVMLAGGSIEANIDRWYGQFQQPDGGSTEKAATVEEKEIADHEVHLVDVSGTFLDRPGPVAPAVAREGYRMLAAIVQTKLGNYFIKFYGPEATVAKNEEAFTKMIDGMKAQ